MSNFTRITRHPLSGKFLLAEWKDDYFGPHMYGVIFPGDTVTYPAEQVNKAKLETFWADDVIEAIRSLYVTVEAGDGEWKNGNDFVLDFLNILNIHYKARWKRDPKGGEGAVEWAMRDE